MHYQFVMIRRKSQGVEQPCKPLHSYKALEQPMNLNSKPKTDNEQIELLTRKLDLLVDSFSKIANSLTYGLEAQQSRINQLQSTLAQGLLPRLEEILCVNRTISDGINKLVSLKSPGTSTSLSTPYNTVGISVSTQQVIPQSLVEVEQEKVPPKIKTSISISSQVVAQGIQKESPCGQQSIHITKMVASVLGMEMMNKQEVIQKQQLLKEISETYAKGESGESLMNQLVGNFYHKRAEFYFTEYKSGRLSYEDMKIKFSFDLIDLMMDLSNKWKKLCFGDSQEALVNDQKTIQSKINFYFDTNEALRKTIRFLLCKYPPSRRKIIDSQLVQKIHETKNFSAVRYDMLKNAKMQMGFDPNQSYFGKEIKTWINMLIKETNQQFPLFRQKMKHLFLGRDNSMEGEIVNEVEYLIGRKIPEGAYLYTDEELLLPGLEIKNPEILRVMMKWCEELLAYFTNPQKMIYNNKFGFKSVGLMIPMRLPKSRLDILVGNLRTAYERILKETQECERVGLSLMHNDLLTLASEGICDGYEFLNNREMTILKFSEHLNEGLKSYVFEYLNYYLRELSRIRTAYDAQKLESNINLVTFGVMDLLRCKCVGTKTDIYRIYQQVMDSKDYFQVIRVKNKLNQATRDILINLKLKNSFLVCEIQLSLGESNEEVNDHFCHYLYQLERSSFGVIFECASQITNLDPRMFYVRREHGLKLKGNQGFKEMIQANTQARDDGIYCSVRHPARLMDLIANQQPFCCLLCGNFINSHSICLSFARCPTCYLNICAVCIVNKYRSNRCFETGYISRNVQCNITMEFFRDIIENSINHPSAYLSVMQKYLESEEYVMHMVVDSVGHNPIVYKKYKKGFIQAFTTIPEVHGHSKDTYNCWNFIAVPKQVQRVRIQDIRYFRKHHLVLEWFQLQKILEERGIEEVMCVFSQKSKAVLILDVVETEESLEAHFQRMKINRVVEICNRTNNLELELTSQNLFNLKFMESITNKTSITSLNLWENNISSLEPLRRYGSLEYLVLRQNQISSLEPILELQNLETIQITENQLSGVLPVLNFPKLRVLDISQNDITEINNILGSKLNSLMLLRAVKTKIREVPIMPLSCLEVLLLENCQIESVQNLSYSNLISLNRLMVADNFVTHIPLLNTQRLREMSFARNKITSMDNLTEQKLPQLKILDLSHNEIGGMIPSLKHFISLTTLNLSFNKLTSIDKAGFENPLLLTLKINNNQIEGEFPLLDTKALTHLDASCNNFSGIADLPFCRIPNIQSINLSQNSIKGSFQPLRLMRLELLNLSQNKLEDVIQLEISRLPNLKDILLSHNRIQGDVPRIYLESLKTIDLSFNNISRLSMMDFMYLVPHLQKIWVYQNPQLRSGDFPEPQSHLIDFEEPVLT